MVRYAITTGEQASETTVSRWVKQGVSIVQLRDKTLDSGELAARARLLLGHLRETEIRLLINSRVDVALAVGAAGVHLTAHPEELMPAQVRKLMRGAVVSVSCHTLAEVERARDAAADWILFGPVFEKRVKGEVVAQGISLAALREAMHVAAPVKVLALGGITETTAKDCVEAGAAGIAAIRMFEKQVRTAS